MLYHVNGRKLRVEETVEKIFVVVVLMDFFSDWPDLLIKYFDLLFSFQDTGCYTCQIFRKDITR